MKNFTLATLVLLLFSTGVCFSQKTYWRFDGTEKTVRDKPKRKTVPNEFRVVTLDFNAIKSELAQTAVRGANGLLTKTVLVDFPMEDGTTETFSMEKTYTLAPELEALYPDITSYFGVSRKNPLNKIYVSLSQLGFAGLVTGEKTIYIDTYDFLRNDGRYIVYDRNKCSRAENDGFECHADVDMVDVESLPPSMQFRNSTDGVLRTFDLAVACTSEYTYYYGNTVANALAAINTTVTRVNSVYKRDFAVVFQVVASNNRLVYRNNVNIDSTPDPDPYDNYDGSQMLSANTSNITGIIGASAYDVGHVFSTGGGGIASTAPCNASSKGSGVTGIVTPQFDPFDIDYVCHEIGHQFGASHTQNNACQRSAAAAMEPGSGSTIMGYAGICAPNVQNNSDAYFHAYSIQQITGGMSGYTCETESSIANAEPTVSTTASYTIPKSTPFILTATGSDSNGDAITYCWEQMNNGTTAGEVMPPASTNTTRPAFRSFTPTTDPTRTFPNLNAVIANVTPTWEVLPSVARTMNFRCTARDNNSLGGQTNQTNTTLTVSGTAGPFVVTAPNTNETWYVGETKAVTWSVNSTNTLSANVNIKLSTDGGYTYPITLASGVTNNGSANVTVPNNIGSNNRVKIEAASNIFFDISNTNFTIKANTFELTTAQNTVSVCSPTNAAYSFTYTPAPSFSSTTTFTASGLPGSATAAFSPTTRNATGSVSLTVGNLTGITPGTYNFNVVGTAGSNVITLPMVLRIFDSTIGAVTLTSPINGAPNQQTSCLLQWNAVSTASSYTVQISTDPTFATVTETATVTATSYQTTSLSAGTINYWRVRPNNPCVNGTFSPSFAFQIASDTCRSYDQEYFEFNDSTWEQSSTNAVSARVDVADNIVISEVSFYMRATHAALGDIKMQFSGPTGIFAEIYNRDCTGSNFDVTWDDDGTVLTCGNVTAATNAGLEGIQQPSQPLSKFDGTSSLGTWVLLATDRGANTSGGTFNEFKVDICGKLQIVNNVTVTNSSVKAPLGQTTTITQSKLLAAQPGAATSDLVYVLTDLPDNGTLKKSNASLSLGQTFTQADINSGALTYTHGGSNSNPDSFTVVVKGTSMALSEAKTTDIEICSFATNPSQTNILCFGAATGSATVAPSGGVAPYTYLWSTGATSASVTGLVAGSYSVTITDAGGCAIPQSFTLTQPAAALTVTAAGQTNINCFGNATGAASVNVSGGTTNYSYNWTPGNPTGDGTASVTGLTAGTWTCTVTDANGCTASQNFTITQTAAALTVTAAGQTNINCFGNATGAASVNVSGGTTNYSYNWTPGNPTGDGTASVTGLTAGTWTCTVTDANGCTASQNFTITQPAAALTVTAAGQTNINCFGNATGAASVNVSGGTTNYSYNWTPGNPTGDGTASVTGLTAGTWTCTVTDANGCTASQNFTITQPTAALSVTVAGQTNINCFGNATGAASVNVSGGTTNYSYNWTPGNPTGDGTASVTGLTAGTWTCTVTDANGCTASQNFTITQPAAALTVTAAGQTNINCFGNATGAASVNVSGGTTNYSYNWTPGNPTGDGTASVTGLTAGTWTCTVTDANGCTASRVFTITQPAAALSVTVAGQTNINCFGNATGAASVNVSGGTTNYSYNWTPGNPTGDGTASVTGLTAGTWTCTVTDANGCTASQNFTITQPAAALSATISSTNVSCFGETSGTATVVPSGGAGGYQYSWSPSGGTAATASGLGAGTYICTITDANGCSITKTADITAPTSTTYTSGGWSNGYPTAGMKAIISADYTASSDLSACILEVTDAAIVTVPSGLDFNIAKQVIVATTAQLIFQNNSNLLQSAAYTTNTNSGKIEVRRNAQMWRQDYVYWSSPVTQQKLRSFSPETLENRFYVLDEPSNSFKGVFTAAPGGLAQAPATYEFVPAKGYMVRAPNTFPNPGSLPQVPTFTGVFTGLANNGNVSIAVTKTASNLGYNLIGNPYPSTVDAYQFLSQNPGTLYFWTHHTQNSSNNNYASFTTLGGSAAYPGGVVPNGQIQIGQGFLYHNTNALTTASFNNTMRTGNNDGQFFRTSNGVHRLWLNLAYEGQGQSQMLLGYTDITTYGVDPGFDGLLIDAGNSIATLIEEVPYVIQARPAFDDTDQVPMHVKATVAGNYTISIADMDGLFLGDQPVFIKDNLTGIVHNIKVSPYSFTTEVGTFDTRFEIVYQDSALGIDQPVAETSAVTVYKNDGILTLDAGKDAISKVTIFDVRGRQLYQKKPVNASSVSLSDFTAEQQVLLIQVTTDKGVVTKKYIY